MGYALAVSLATRLRINAKSTTELNDAFGEVVKIVKEDVPAWDVQSVTHLVTDFDQGQGNALLQVFPRAQLVGCFVS